MYMYPFMAKTNLHFCFQSLKKEIDWDRSDDKSIGESSSDYRHSHDSVSFFNEIVTFKIQILFN